MGAVVVLAQHPATPPAKKDFRTNLGFVRNLSSLEAVIFELKNVHGQTGTPLTLSRGNDWWVLRKTMAGIPL